MSGDQDDEDRQPAGTQRLDKWLWFVRVVKSRTQAAALVTGGKVRLNRARVDKPSHTVKVGDVVTVSAHHRVRVLRVVGPGLRRGPPTEAQLLYQDLSPPSEQCSSAASEGVGPDSGTASRRETGTGRPTKRERRALDTLRGRRG